MLTLLDEVESSVSCTRKQVVVDIPDLSRFPAKDTIYGSVEDSLLHLPSISMRTCSTANQYTLASRLPRGVHRLPGVDQNSTPPVGALLHHRSLRLALPLAHMLHPSHFGEMVPFSLNGLKRLQWALFPAHLHQFAPGPLERDRQEGSSLTRLAGLQ